MSMTHPDIERYERIGAPYDPEPEWFHCPICECDVPEGTQVETETGKVVCKDCCVVCDGPCGSIYTIYEVEKIGDLKMCQECASETRAKQDEWKVAG